MFKENADIDKLFRDNLVDHTVRPPDYIWNNLERALRKSDRKRMFFLFGITGSVAAAILIILFIGWWSYTPPLHVPSSHSLISSSADVPGPENPGSHAAVTEKEAPGMYYNEHPDVDIELQAMKANDEAISRHAVVKGMVAENDSHDSNIYSFLKNMIFRIGESPEKLFSNDFSLESLIERNIADFHYYPEKVEKKEKPENEIPVIAAARLPYGGDIVMRDVSNKWSLMAVASPSYWGNMPDYNENSYSTKAEIGISGGLMVDLKLSKKFSVRGGVVYSNMKHRTSNIKVRSHNTVHKQHSDASNTVTVVVGNVILPVRLSNITGVDNMISNGFDSKSGVPNGLELTKGLPEYDVVIKQNIEYLEMPLVLSYKLIERELNLEVNGGLNFNLLVNSSAKAFGDDGLFSRNLNNTGLRDVVYAGSLGLGIGYGLSDNISFALEPKIFYYLNSINYQGVDAYNPSRFGLYAGVVYLFN